MPTIDISREQLAYVEALREEIEDEVPYGQVRNLDAVQYLIDHHREDGDLDIEIDGDLEADLDQEEAADGGRTVSAPGTTDEGTGGSPGKSGDGADASGQATDETTGADDPGSQDGDDGGVGGPTPDPGSVAAASGDDESTTRISGGPDPSQLSGSSGDDTLNEMMNLLEAHEDVWEESDAGETKYRVELPEGEVEGAATKDDVRALLFKHYR
jgi:hypothetical protein